MAGGGANADMAALWNGPSGDHWVAYDHQHDRALTLPDIPPDAPGPFSLGEPDRVRTLLGAAGFTGIELDEVAGPMFLGDSAEAATTFLEGTPMTTRLLEGKDPELVARALAAMRATVDDLAGPDGLSLPAKAWVVTATRAG